jgi:hypothetical protein
MKYVHFGVTHVSPRHADHFLFYRYARCSISWLDNFGAPTPRSTPSAPAKGPSRSPGGFTQTT